MTLPRSRTRPRRLEPLHSLTDPPTPHVATRQHHPRATPAARAHAQPRRGADSLYLRDGKISAWEIEHRNGGARLVMAVGGSRFRLRLWRPKCVFNSAAPY